MRSANSWLALIVVGYNPAVEGALRDRAAQRASP